MTDKELCPAKHTPFQPTVEQWICPHCRSDSDLFIIDERPDNADPACSELHNKDTVVCLKCDRSWSGIAIAKAMSKKLGFTLVKCTCCDGTGFVEVNKEPSRSRKSLTLTSVRCSCSFCSKDIDIEADDWNAMLTQIKDEGWEYKMVNNKWKYKCPSCVEEGKPWREGLKK